MKDFFPLSEMAWNCIMDVPRTNRFEKSLKKIIAKGDIVLDVGGGSGILSMLAVRYGAKKVFCIEKDIINFNALKENIKLNGFEKQIICINKDYKKCHLPKKVDVLICEMYATGLITELQVDASNRLLRKYKNVKVLSERVDSFIDFTYHKNTFSGFEFSNIAHEYPPDIYLDIKSFSEKYKYSSIDLKQIVLNKKIDIDLTMKITKSGIINSIRISSLVYLYGNVMVGESNAFNYPFYFYLPKQKVKIGDEFLVKISYILNGGYDNFKYSVKKKK